MKPAKCKGVTGNSSGTPEPLQQISIDNLGKIPYDNHKAHLLTAEQPQIRHFTAIKRLEYGSHL